MYKYKFTGQINSDFYIDIDGVVSQYAFINYPSSRVYTTVLKVDIRHLQMCKKTRHIHHDKFVEIYFTTDTMCGDTISGPYFFYNKDPTFNVQKLVFKAS